jgi:hypothetical protein
LDAAHRDATQDLNSRDLEMGMSCAVSPTNYIDPFTSQPSLLGENSEPQLSSENITFIHSMPNLLTIVSIQSVVTAIHVHIHNLVARAIGKSLATIFSLGFQSIPRPLYMKDEGSLARRRKGIRLGGKMVDFDLERPETSGVHDSWHVERSSGVIKRGR